MAAVYFNSANAAAGGGWEEYGVTLTEALGAKRAAIISLDGLECGYSKGFVLSKDVRDYIKDNFKNQTLDNVSLGGDKYTRQKGSLIADNHTYLEKVGGGGVCIAKTNTVFIIGTHDEKIRPQKFIEQVLGVAKYLMENDS